MFRAFLSSYVIGPSTTAPGISTKISFLLQQASRIPPPWKKALAVCSVMGFAYECGPRYTVPGTQRKQVTKGTVLLWLLCSVC